MEAQGEHIGLLESNFISQDTITFSGYLSPKLLCIMDLLRFEISFDLLHVQSLHHRLMLGTSQKALELVLHDKGDKGGQIVR